jgi:Xaa-Pro aminopeptidase
VERIGIEPSRVSYEFVRHLARRVPKAEFVPLKREFLENFRIRKSPQEKHNIARAAVLASEACQEVLNAGLTGRSERDVAVDLEFRTLRKGAHGIAFGTIVAAGRRSALPHGTATDRIIGPGELVIIDYGCRFDGYCSDETVTCVTGSPGSDQKKLHKAVYDAHMRALEAVREGVSVRQIDRIARSSLENDGLGKHFKHGLGHGVGLEIHEAPFLSAHGRGTLVEGMVFTIEPGVYIEDVGGVRLESLVYLGPQGTEVLCTMPKDLIVVG